MPDHLRALFDLGLCCPRCRGDLQPDVRDGEGSLRCAACAVDYPVLLGIPDLRVFPDPYIGLEADRAKGRRLAAEGGRTWEDLVHFYYAVTDSVPAAQAAAFAAGLSAARARADSTLAAWDVLDDAPVPVAQRTLDVGCGTAPLLAASAARGGVAVGVDIAFRWLVVAQRRLRDTGVRAPLVCACAEALPFRDRRFDLVMTEGTLENVRDAQGAAAEALRVLAPSGRFRVATANRWSLGPDPHLGLPLGGLLPEAAASWWARRRRMLPPQRHLLSVRALRRLLERAGFERCRVGVPRVAAAQLRARGVVLRAAAAVYAWAQAARPLRRLLLAVGPTLLAITRRPAGNP